MLRKVRTDPPEGVPEMPAALERYVSGVAQHGFRPMRLYFAIQRYRRWAALTDEPTSKARAQTLQEFWETYGLSDLAAAYPEARVRFFRQTVFGEAPEKLALGLDAMIAALRRRELSPDEIADSIAELRSGIQPDPDDDYFLARLSFPYLRPEDTATFELAQRAGKRASEMVVVLEDLEGNRYRVRHAMTAKEVGRLHRLFLAAKLDVRFRPEHQFLVALNDRNQIIGGIYYDVDSEAQSAHLEKIVVADAYRKLGVSDGLMTEFENRVRTLGARVVTTGFFRPEYFYAKGFKIGKAYAGLVKELEEQP